MSAAHSPWTPRPRAMRMRVLIGEDEAASAAALVERVRALGHDPVGPFADGAVALAAALVEPPDAYVLAPDLPGIDGPALARRLQEHGLRGAVILLPVEPAALEAALAAARAGHAERHAVVSALRPRRLGPRTA
jgi:DNA-binding response OmpR family regulator